MCGRFTLKTPADAIRRQLDLFSLHTNDALFSCLKPRYNIAPQDRVFVLRTVTPETRHRATQPFPALEVVEMQWGIVCGSATTTQTPIINTRVETLADNKFFPGDHLSHHCLILADGYYEWKKTAGRKIPYYFYRPDKSLFLLAGLWRNTPAGDFKLPTENASCTIITVPANKSAAQIHDRMPAISFDHTSAMHWLVDNQLYRKGQSFLTAPGDAWLRRHTVHTQVNRVGFDRPECIEPISFDKQRALF